MEPDVRAAATRFTGFAPNYDAFRPTPPAVASDILCIEARNPAPDLVVDLGCGTGLSTRLWQDRAARVIGFDISEDMLRQAREATAAPCVEYRFGLSGSTGLPPACAAIATCSQSLHWMDPDATFAEVARILAPGGVFGAYDCDWPPVVGSWRLETAESEVIARAARIHRERALAPDLRQWSKDGHLARMRASGRFRHVREVTFHSVEHGNAARFVGLLLTQGVVQTVLRSGVGEDELGIAALRATAAEEIGEALRPWVFAYRMRMGIV